MEIIETVGNIHQKSGKRNDGGNQHDDQHKQNLQEGEEQLANAPPNGIQEGTQRSHRKDIEGDEEPEETNDRNRIGQQAEKRDDEYATVQALHEFHSRYVVLPDFSMAFVAGSIVQCGCALWTAMQHQHLEAMGAKLPGIVYIYGCFSWQTAESHG